MLRKQFFRKFAKPELKFIAGKKYSNLIILSVILIISMLAIGLGKGAIQYLDEKMNSPFVSFVNVKIPAYSEYTIAKMDAIHNKNHPDTSFADFYGFKKYYPVFDTWAGFTNLTFDPKRYKLARVRKAMEKDPIYEDILEKDKIKKLEDRITKHNSFQFDGWGCVVSLAFLKNDKTKLTYNDISNIAYLRYQRSIDDKDVYISIPIQGYVNYFPDDIDMIIGERFFDAIEDPDFWRSLVLPDNEAKNGYMQYYVMDNDSLSDYFVKNNFDQLPESEGIMHKKGKMYAKYGLSVDEKKKLVDNLPKLHNSYNVLDFYRTDPPRIALIEDQEKQAFVFQFTNESLSSIEEFNFFLKALPVPEGDDLLEIDMRIIESKKNFDLFKRLADLLSFALIAFSILSLVLYITNLIVSHISKNKKNLGTLKAFGLSNNNIILIYSSISIVLIAISFVLSIMISELAGNTLIKLIANCFKIGDASTLSYVRYPIHWLAAFFIVLPSIAIYLKLWWELRKSTPGDLIYGRE